jgi:arylsulfatase A-like enzyme
MRRLALLALVLTVAKGIFVPPSRAQQMSRTEKGSTSAHSPNVVLIMTDDQGYGDIRAHGNQEIETPNIDRLYRQSIRLTDFHVDPTCSPTRAALLTGRYSTQTGVWHTIAGRSLLKRDEVTIADVFSENGYRTGIFGKWHLGDNYPFRPQDNGFQEVLVHGGGGISQTPDYWGNDYFDDYYLHNGQWKKTQGYSTKVVFDHALEFINRNRNERFFAYLPTNVAHGPRVAPKSYVNKYLEEGFSEKRGKFYGMISAFDEQLGRLREKLRQWNLAENTILIFMTDNGTALRNVGATAGGYNAGMRGRKGSVYEGGHRVPFFIRWPAGGLTGGRAVNALTAHIDVLPTLMDLTRVDSANDLSLAGKSLEPLLRDEVESWPNRKLFVHSQRIQHPEKWRKSAVMTEQWRLINGEKLYNLRRDSSQQDNVAGEHPKVVESLRQAYDEWWKSLTDRFGQYPRIVLGSGHENPSRLTAHDWHNPESNVPWNQRMIQEDPAVNGWWAVNIAREGTYRVTLRQRPKQVDFPLKAATVRLKIGDRSWSTTVLEEKSKVVFEVELTEGPVRMQTWITSAEGISRGAYYVSVKYVSNSL